MMLLPLPELDAPQAASPVDYGPVLDRLAESGFRRRKRLLGSELEQLRARGMEEVVRHAGRFVEQRLAPAVPENDGRQTPSRGHPVFIAQHATATCCRGCLETWHAIPKGRALHTSEVRWITGLLAAWLGRETGIDVAALLAPPSPQPRPTARRPRRGPHNLRLIVADDDPETDSAHTLVLEERTDDGALLRRWLQLELFGE